MIYSLEIYKIKEDDMTVFYISLFVFIATIVGPALVYAYLEGMREEKKTNHLFKRIYVQSDYCVEDRPGKERIN